MLFTVPNLWWNKSSLLSKSCCFYILANIDSSNFDILMQITTLVNAKEKPIRSERTLAALVRVGQAVNLAVERFVGVGEAIANDNPEIHNEMCDACRDAKMAGLNIPF